MRKQTYNLEEIGINPRGYVHRNLDIDNLVKKSVERGEGKISKRGALTVTTGKYTGRSPNDKFIVDDNETHEKVNWGKVNLAISEERFGYIYKKIIDYLSQKEEIFIFDGMVGAEPKHTLHVRVINELASQNLFITHLLRRPSLDELKNHTPGFTVVVAPGCHAMPDVDGTNSEVFIILDFTKRIAIIGGTKYAGEIKKAIFTLMNYLLPQEGVLPMHCSANIGKNGDVALFFGLSGTGKTTLSADPDRRLIGDDEHGWSENGIFNFEGGCYAKCINLKEEHEPQIYNSIRHGTVVENVVMHPETLDYDFCDCSITENTRAGFPINYIPNAELSGMGGHPKSIIFLTADAFGVMPPVARLTIEQAIYHFMSGYTSKLAGTERGIIEPQATFSAFFGAPFMPLKPMVYSNLFKAYVKKYKPSIFLINTGWQKGSYGVGERISIKDTRTIVTSALNGNLDDVDYDYDPMFNLYIPRACNGIDNLILKPINLWTDKQLFEKNARELALMFVKNFGKYTDIPGEIVDAGPRVGYSK